MYLLYLYMLTQLTFHFHLTYYTHVFNVTNFMFICNFKHNISTTTLQDRHLTSQTKKKPRNKNQLNGHLPIHIR